MAILSARTLANVRRIRTQVLTDVQDGFSPTTFVAWRKDRPAGTWDDGSEDEGWVEVVSGEGFIRNGQEVQVIGEGLIYQEARFDFRTAVSHGIEANQYLVIDGDRLFSVEGSPKGDLEKPIVHCTLKEVFDMDLPEVTP